MTIEIITASAGSGKTSRLSKVLQTALLDGSARPEHIIATTFTKKAAAELIERARGRLLESNEPERAHQLLAARIGTVNSVCGALVSDFAFELGVSPSLRILEPAAAEVELRRALATVVSVDTADDLESLQSRFEGDLSWGVEVRKVIEAARANGLTADDMRVSAERSLGALDECLGPVQDETVISSALERALSQAIDAIDTQFDTTKTTAKYLKQLRDARWDLSRGRLSWGDWAKLSSCAPAKKSKDAAPPVQEAAQRHVAHPALRAQMRSFIETVFEVAASGLSAYQAHKRERGLLDFVDQEALALELLRRDDVRAELAGEIDLVLSDEFQDTSPIQLAIFLELARLAKRSVWVGDPKQSIFGFRGTDPALMDAAIESLTSPTHDPDLVEKAADALVAGPVETLSTSFRSRPELVAVTNSVFAPAFASYGLAEDHTRLEAHLDPEPEGLGSCVEYWPLQKDGKANNKGTRARAVAEGVRQLLADDSPVRNRADDAVRPGRAGDVAVLCRTNQQCHDVSVALAGLGVNAVVPRVGLFDSAEAQLVLSGLRLWVDPRDSLAMAEVARIVSYPTQLDALAERIFEDPGTAGLAGDPVVARVLQAREAQADRNLVGVVDALIDALELRKRCAGWGQAAQRIANLDAVRWQVASYCAEAEARGEAASIVGFLGFVEEMVEEWGWQKSRTDDQALLGADEAVTVSTWHRAKGLEWPIVVLYGLESLRTPSAYGVHVESDRGDIDVADPLADRWVRFWPNPYNTSNQKGPVRDAVEATPLFYKLAKKTRREALRVLYVGWTRARDRLVFAPQEGKLFDGIVGTVTEIDSALMKTPVETGETAWGGKPVDIEVTPMTPATLGAPEVASGSYWEARGGVPHPPARLSPSSLVGPAEIGVPGELKRIGERIPLTGSPNMTHLGEAIHGFLAADNVESDRAARLAMAEGLLERWGVNTALDAVMLLQASDGLNTWLGTEWPGASIRREWSIAQRLVGGTTLQGVADLVLELPEGFVVIDHKSFPGTIEEAGHRAATFSGQLAAYSSALSAALKRDCLGRYLHLPVLGLVVSVEPTTRRTA